MDVRVSVLGIGFLDATMDEALGMLSRALEDKGGGARSVFFPNASTFATWPARTPSTGRC